MTVRNALAFVDRVQEIMETKDEEDLEVLCLEVFGDVSDDAMGLAYRAREVVYRRWTLQTRREMAEAHAMRSQ